MVSEFGEKIAVGQVGKARRANQKINIVDIGANLTNLDVAKAALGLVSRYAFAGNGNDSHGTKHLTAFGSPTFVDSPIGWGQAVDYESESSQYHEGSTSDHDLGTGDLWVKFYWKPETVNVLQRLLGKLDSAVNTNKGWAVDQDATGKIVARLCDGSAAVISVTGNTVLQAGSVYCIYVEWKRNGNASICIDNVLDNAGLISAQQLTASNAVNFRIGRDGGASTNHADGVIEHVEIGTTLPTTDQRRQMFEDLHAGTRVRSTTTSNGFIKDTDYIRDSENTAWLIQPDIAPNTEVYPHSTTIGDYVSPIAGLGSDNDGTISRGAGDSDLIGFHTDGTLKGVAARITKVSLRNRRIKSFTLNLKKSGSPSGTLTARLRKTSDNSVVATASETVDASALGTAYSTFTFNFAAGTLTPNEDFRLALEGTITGTNSNVQAQLQTAGYADGVTDTADGSGTWSQNTTNDLAGNMTFDDGNQATDNNTGTKYETESVLNPWLRLELSASADKEPAAVAIHPHANMTASQIKIQTSPDGSAWTDKRLINVSALTMGAYNYIRLNRDSAQVRYVRIYVPDGVARILAINEVKVLTPTESQWNRQHGHKLISATEASLTLAGGL